MDKNNRSTQLFYIATDSLQRADTWHRIFGTDILPVLSDQPRAQEKHGRTLLAYDLALAHLHYGQRMRLAAHAARRTRIPYPEMRRTIETAVSWPIDATDDIKLVEVALPPPAFIIPQRETAVSPEYGRTASPGDYVVWPTSAVHALC